MKKECYLPLFIFFSLFFCYTEISYAADSIKIIGTIKESTGEGIAFVKLTFHHSKKNFIAETTTDMQGTFSVNLIPGNYQIVAEKIGFTTFFTNISVNKSTPPILNFILDHPKPHRTFSEIETDKLIEIIVEVLESHDYKIYRQTGSIVETLPIKIEYKVSGLIYGYYIGYKQKTFKAEIKESAGVPSNKKELFFNLIGEQYPPRSSRFYPVDVENENEEFFNLARDEQAEFLKQITEKVKKQGGKVI